MSELDSLIRLLAKLPGLGPRSARRAALFLLERRERELRNEVAAHPLVQAVLETFPGATIAAIRERSELDPGEEMNPEEDGP